MGNPTVSDRLLEHRNSLIELAKAFRAAGDREVADTLFTLADEVADIRRVVDLGAAAWAGRRSDAVRMAVRNINARRQEPANNVGDEDEPAPRMVEQAQAPTTPLICPHCEEATNILPESVRTGTQVICDRCKQPSRVDCNFDSLDVNALELVKAG